MQPFGDGAWETGTPNGEQVFTVQAVTPRAGWQEFALFSLVLLMAYLLDAAVRRWRLGDRDSKRRAGVHGASCNAARRMAGICTVQPGSVDGVSAGCSRSAMALGRPGLQTKSAGRGPGHRRALALRQRVYATHHLRRHSWSHLQPAVVLWRS